MAQLAIEAREVASQAQERLAATAAELQAVRIVSQKLTGEVDGMYERLASGEVAANAALDDLVRCLSAVEREALMNASGSEQKSIAIVQLLRYNLACHVMRTCGECLQWGGSAVSGTVDMPEGPTSKVADDNGVVPTASFPNGTLEAVMRREAVRAAEVDLEEKRQLLAGTSLRQSDLESQARGQNQPI